MNIRNGPASGDAIMQTKGFKRLGLALCAAWLLVTGAVVSYELATRKVGYFVEMTLPVGTVITGNEAALPDGRIVHLDTTIAPGATQAGRIQWDGDPAVAELHVQRLLLAVAVGIPIVAWLSIDGIALAVGWVGRGFRRSTPANTH
jgi:hypothetical protein